MADVDDLVELLFFDTFSHEIHEDLNLDLVQFPKPVYITEIRIIPLGARVQADFPGGVRLGATNPSKFGVQFFVNDLSKPGASAFEILGDLEYNQNDCIHLECHDEKIPTDGLVLRGWYTTITLAVYGTLTNNIAGQIDSPPHPVEPVPEEVTAVPAETIAIEPVIAIEQPVSLPDEMIPQPVPEIFEREVFSEPKFEANFEQPPYLEEAYYQSSSQDGTRDREQKRVSRRKSHSSERSNSRHRTYSRSDSNDREYSSRTKREWSRSPEYRHSRRSRRDRSRDIADHSERDHKWPRSPPSQHIGSPRRPRSPETVDHFSDIGDDSDYKYRQKNKAAIQPARQIEDEPVEAVLTPSEIPEGAQEAAPIDEDTLSQGEQFEPILSDDEIMGDDDNNNDEQENEELEIEEDDEDLIKVYDPFKCPLNKFEYDLTPSCTRDIELFDKLLSKYEQQTKINKVENFLESTNDEKENFVYISEQLLTHLSQINLSSFSHRNFLLKAIFHDRKDHLALAANVLNTALNYECACSQPQPGFKVRHIKIGARLAESLAASDDFVSHYILTERRDPFKGLFDLYEQQYMALSIKLLILRAIYANLDSKLGMTTFLTSKLNGYQRVLTLLLSNSLTRAKFALKSILKKVHLYQAFESIHDLVARRFVLAEGDASIPSETIEGCLKEVSRALSSERMSYQQPKRFLPVSEKFEIVKDANSIKNWSHMLRSYLRTFAFTESLLLILSNYALVPSTLIDLTLEMIQLLVRSPIGIDYLAEDCFETTQVLVKCLLNVVSYTVDDLGEEKKTDEDGDIKAKPKIMQRDFDRFQKLGIEVSYRMQTHYHMNAIANAKDDVDTLMEHLHALYGQTCSNPGRTYTVEALTSIHENIAPLLYLIEKERKCQVQRNPDSPALKYKSPVLSYSVDLIDCCVRYAFDVNYLAEHEQILVDLVKNHEIFESSVSAVLQEMAVFLKPLESGNVFSYDDISSICEVIKRSVEYITTFPGDLIMALRILRHLGIADENINYEKQTKELKHRYVTLQFYSTDGVTTILSILEKLNTYFEQPGLHSATLMTMQAVQACQILQPALHILREMITFVIQCRDAQFKDITAIENLLKTYALMHYYPEASQAYEDAQAIKAEIIKILLAYTQPNPQDQESVHKSLWTQMIRELIKFILSAPSTFIPGLQVFAELLPLPFPIQTIYPPSEVDAIASRFVTERKLWSAHLHPQSTLIAEMIQTICPSSFPQLVDLLTRVCLQLADLAPNMTLLVSKTVTDLILNENSMPVGTSGQARLLKFLAQLTAYASVKISSLSILSGRLYEFFNQILTNADKSEHHIQCQIHVHRIYENYFDSEISMISPNTTGSLELNLACALPSKELIPGIINAIVVNLFNADLQSEVAIAACRNLIILTEHDITFYHLKTALDAKKQQLQDWLTKIVETDEKNVHRGLLGTVVLLIRAQMFIDESGPDSLIPIRTLKLTVSELASILGWTTEKSSSHPLNKLKERFSQDGEDNPNNPYLQDVNIITSILDKFEVSETDKKPEVSEPVLPQAEGIITQYLSRPIFTPYEPADDAQLISDYWLEPIRLDSIPENILMQAERITCDLNEVVKTCLPSDTNLTSDCKRVLHLSASPQSNRERTTTAPCFRTRRVEVEPSTGRPEKKIFVTPMRGRGFARTPPSRGDLFRSRPPNTSRPPSLHVDDFLALETCGAQPTGPTGYNKISREIINIRGNRVGRNRGNRIQPISNNSSYRTGSPSTWSHESSSAPQHFRTATSEPVVSSHFASDSHYSQPHFGGAPIRSRGRGRPRTFIR